MIGASKLAGFFGAHAVWCVCDGRVMKTPMLAYFTADGERMMDRLEADHFSGSPVEMGIDKLTSNEMDATEAALLYDGRIVLGEEWLDAIIIEMRTYAEPDAVAI